MEYVDIDSDNFFEINMIKDYNSETMKKITVNEINFLKKYLTRKDAKILDIMCGYGRLANNLCKEGYSSITGIDIGDYPFIPEKKQFKFIKANFYKADINDTYDYCYSMYNSYPNLNIFKDTIDRSEKLLEDNGTLIIDIFSKEWRDNLDSFVEKDVLENDRISVKLKRTYDGDYETTTFYILNKKTNEIKDYKYTQCVVSKEKLLNLVSNSWDKTLLSSEEEKTREDNQKHILVLKKKVK